MATNTSTIKASGGDYTTITLWEADTDNDLVAAGDIEVGECYDDWAGGLDDVLVIAGATVDASNYRKLTVAAGNRHDGTPQTGFYIKGDSGGNTTPTLQVSEGYCQLEWLDIENTRTTGSSAGALEFDTGSLINGKYLIIACRAGSSEAFRGTFGSSTQTNWPVMESCLAYDGASGFSSSDSVRRRYKAFNCVAANCGTGFNGGSTNDPVIYNCAGFNNGSIDFNANMDANGDYNASEDTSANVFTNYVTGLVAGDFVGDTTDDFHMVSTSSALYHVGGTTLAATLDIDGDTFDASTPSIGIDEIVSGGSPYTLTADSGAYAVAGTASGLQYGRKLGALTGTYLAAGQAISLEYGRKVGASNGSYAVSGQAAGLQYGRVLSSVNGTYAVTGQDATLIHDTGGVTYTLIAAAGAYTVAGTAASLERGYNLVATVGVYTVNGSLASLTWSGAAEAGAGPAITMPLIISNGAEAALPVSIAVSSGGGVAGLSVSMLIRNGATLDSYLDFDDLTFKTSGWVSQTDALVDQGGGYYADTLNVGGITNLPDTNLIVEFTVSGSLNAVAMGSIISAKGSILGASNALTLGKFLALKDV